MDGLLVATLVLGLWAGGLFLTATLDWYERRGDRRLAADVSVALSANLRERISSDDRRRT